MRADVDTPGQLEQLFVRYRDRGDVAAIAQVYDLTAVRLLSLATHLCTNPSEAEDAVQATFLAALGDAHSWQADRPLMPWLLGILTNRVRRQRRDASRQPDAARLRLDGPRDPAEVMAEVEFSHAVDEAIESLPRMYQAALVLRLKHGMDPVDIAHALRRPAGTVRSQLSRGMELLRKALPAVFAGSVAVWALPTRGLAAVRETVVHAAHDAQATWFWSAWPWLRRGLLAACASLLVALVWLSSNSAAAALPNVEPAAASTEPRATLETSNELASASDFDMQSQPAEREPAISTGELRVHLHRGGTAVPAAPLRAELLGDTPAHLVRRLVLGNITRIHRSALWDATRSQGREPARGASTDARGAATLADLPPGYWLLHLPGTSGVVHVRPGLASEVHHELGNDAIEVEGTVLDGAGRALAGAWIWAGRESGATNVQPLLQTDAEGRFRTCLPRSTVLSARAEGHLPHSVVLNPAEPRTQLQLVCAAGGGTIEGVVLDADGAPLQDAFVEVGDDADVWPRQRQPGVIAVHGAPSTLRTDHAGRFCCEGLVPGRVRVSARVHGGREVTHEAVVLAGERSAVTLQIAAGATLHGVVTDRLGQPVPFEQVRVLARGEHHEMWASTDAMGRYELRGVPPGTIVAVAGLGAAGTARARLECNDQDRVEWHAVLDPGPRTIRGRVLGPDGRPGRYRVALEAPRRQDDTDADGRFTFVVPDDRLDHMAAVLVYPPGDVAAPTGKPPTSGALAWRTDIAPGCQDVQIRVEDVLRTASVQGAVVVDDLADVGPITLVHELPWNRFMLPSPIEQPSRPVAVRAERLPAGDYRLLVKGRQVAHFRLQAGEHLDLGELVVRASGLRQVAEEPHAPGRRLLAFVRPEDDGLAGMLQVEVRDERGRELGWVTPFGSSTLWTIPVVLPVGRYRIVASDGTGLFAEEELVLDENVDEVYARRILLRRR